MLVLVGVWQQPDGSYRDCKEMHTQLQMEMHLEMYTEMYGHPTTILPLLRSVDDVDDIYIYCILYIHTLLGDVQALSRGNLGKITPFLQSD